MPKPDLGENVRVFSPNDDPADIARVCEDIFKKQHHRQFGPDRHALLFLPGDYVKAGTINVGYYTQILGLGRSPRDVKLCNVKTPAALDKNNATCNFWVGIENVCTVEIANGDGPLVGINAIVNGKGHAIRTGKGSGGGFGVQRVYRYSAGKADVAPDCYSTRR